MIKHVVLIKFKDGYDEQLLQAMIAKLNLLCEEIPELNSFTHGKNAGIGPGKFDYGIVADFNDEASYHTYINHPAHKAVGAEMMQILAEPASMQFVY